MLTVAGRASTEQLQPDLVFASGAIATAPGDNCITLAIVIIGYIHFRNSTSTVNVFEA